MIFIIQIASNSSTANLLISVASFLTALAKVRNVGTEELIADPFLSFFFTFHQNYAAKSLKVHQI